MTPGSSKTSSMIPTHSVQLYWRHSAVFLLAMVGSLSYSAATTQTAAQSYATIVASRSIGGIGVGTLAMGAPLYISEISPPAWRGSFWVLEAISIVTGAIGMERYRSQQALLKREYPDYARHPLLVGIKQWVDLSQPKYLRRTLLACPFRSFSRYVAC